MFGLFGPRASEENDKIFAECVAAVFEGKVPEAKTCEGSKKQAEDFVVAQFQMVQARKGVDYGAAIKLVRQKFNI